MRGILRNRASLDEVEKQANRIFSRAKPVFLLLADTSGLMQVEVGQAGKFRLVRQDNGTMSHTNHYADPDLLNQPQTISDSSQARLGTGTQPAGEAADARSGVIHGHQPGSCQRPGSWPVAERYPPVNPGGLADCPAQGRASTAAAGAGQPGTACPDAGLCIDSGILVAA